MPDVLNDVLAQTLALSFDALTWQQRIEALKDFPKQRIAFSTSFSFEDQAITHVIAGAKLPVRIFTLDTGRLFEETQTLHQKTCDTYGIAIHTFAPEAKDIQDYITKNGTNGFLKSVENRKECCRIRKVVPLARALKGADIWISGLRHEHSQTRSNLKAAEWDARDNVIKLYPLIDVTTDEVWSFIKAHNIPYNPMHDQGFPSIGCAPCTRAITPGEHPRAGRWWWEQNGAQECGLHMVDGKLIRVE